MFPRIVLRVGRREAFAQERFMGFVMAADLPISFLVTLTHEDLGSMVDLSLETVSRLLARFRREGHVLQIHDRTTINHPIQMEAHYC